MDVELQETGSENGGPVVSCRWDSQKERHEPDKTRNQNIVEISTYADQPYKPLYGVCCKCDARIRQHFVRFDNREHDTK